MNSSAWIENTGSPTVHPFPSSLNPNASEFVPHPNTVSDSSQTGQVFQPHTPPPFSFRSNPIDSQGSLPISTETAVQSASITINVLPKNNKPTQPLQIQNGTSANNTAPLAPSNCSSKEIPPTQIEEPSLNKDPQHTDQGTSTSSHYGERYDQNTRHSASLGGRGKYNNYSRTNPKERSFDRHSANNTVRLAPSNFPSKEIPPTQIEESSLNKELQHLNQETSTTSHYGERYDQNTRPSASLRGRGGYNNYQRTNPMERSFDRDSANNTVLLAPSNFPSKEIPPTQIEESSLNKEPQHPDQRTSTSSHYGERYNQNTRYSASLGGRGGYNNYQRTKERSFDRDKSKETNFRNQQDNDFNKPYSVYNKNERNNKNSEVFEDNKKWYHYKYERRNKYDTHYRENFKYKDNQNKYNRNNSSRDSHDKSNWHQNRKSNEDRNNSVYSSSKPRKFNQNQNSYKSSRDLDSEKNFDDNSNASSDPTGQSNSLYNKNRASWVEDMQEENQDSNKDKFSIKSTDWQADPNEFKDYEETPALPNNPQEELTAPAFKETKGNFKKGQNPRIWRERHDNNESGKSHNSVRGGKYKSKENSESNSLSDQKLSTEVFDKQTNSTDLAEAPSVMDSLWSKELSRRSKMSLEDETFLVPKESKERQKKEHKEFKNTESQKNQTRITETEKYNNNAPIKSHDFKAEAKQGSERSQENKSLDNQSQFDQKINENSLKDLGETTSFPDNHRTLDNPATKESNKTNDRKSDKNKNFNKTETMKPRDLRMEREKLNKSDSVCSDPPLKITKNRYSEGSYKQMKKDDLSKDNLEKEFDIWEKQWGKFNDFKRVEEIDGDLFQQPKDYSLAHCVAEDLRMGSGIAVHFKREFKNLPDLLDQKAKQGGLAVLPDDENKRFVYYLVTKKESNGKPTYFTLWKSLYKMREHIKENNVKKVAAPRLGCGLDRLEWDKVKSMLEHLFKEVDVEIRVCNFQQSEQAEEKKFKNKLVFEEFPITKIETGTLILYLATSNNEQDDVIKHLATKFNFWSSFKSQQKSLGEIVYYDDKVQNYGLCGCIVRRTTKDPVSFKSMQQCLQTMNKMNNQFRNNAFNYVAFQWMDEDAYLNELINQKFITMITTFLKNVDLYVCRGSIKDEGK